MQYNSQPILYITGFDAETLDIHFMALDPERVGLENIEVPQICDFGDNELDYMTHGGRNTSTAEELFNYDDEANDEGEYTNDNDESDTDSSCSHSSDDSVSTTRTESIDYHGVLPSKFIAFLKS